VFLLALAALAHADELETAAVTAELGRSYDDERLRRAAASPRAATRRAAARAAGRLRDERALSWLLPLLDDPAGPVRRSALFALGQIGGENLAIPLRARLPRLSTADLPRALEALGRSRDPRAVSEVVRYLGHREGAVRGAAALALFRLQDASALPELFAALLREAEDRRVPVGTTEVTVPALDDAGARWRMVYAAWYLLRQQARRTKEPVRVDPLWMRLLRGAAAADRPVHERIFAVRALGAVAGERDWMLGLLNDGDPRVVLEAIRASARPWDLATAERVSAFVRHEDPLLREVALEHLMVGEKKAAALLRQAGIDLADDIRLQIKAVEAALAAGDREIEAPTEQGEHRAEDFEATVWRFGSYHPDRLPRALPTTTRGRVVAAEVCGENRVPREFAVQTLLQLLKVEDFVVRAVSIGALAAREAKEHAAAIVAAARNSPGTADMDVRIEAARALAKLKRYDPWLREAAAEDRDRPVREAARTALLALGRKAPAAPPPTGFRLHGHDAAGVLAAARALVGARVTLKTSRGEIEMVLLPDEAPAHCVNFATLVQQGFYDGLTWHRVVGNFVVQGGCPRGDGWGGPGYLLPDEIGTRPYVRGTVGMPKADDDTGGCQLFITHLPTPHLDGRYTVFAQVVRGLAVPDRLRIGDKILQATIRIAGDK
jgi:cyclophilin family peptidyl-prolyl cis-trans isomerase/HEAT repeat protein